MISLLLLQAMTKGFEVYQFVDCDLQSSYVQVKLSNFNGWNVKELSYAQKVLCILNE